MIRYLYDTPDVSDLTGLEVVVIGYLDDAPDMSDHVGLGIVRYEDDPTDAMIDRGELYVDVISRDWYGYDVMTMIQRAIELQSGLVGFVIVNLVVELGSGYNVDGYYKRMCGSCVGIIVEAVIHQ